jgi:heavy metal translocating P-type ATPase
MMSARSDGPESDASLGRAPFRHRFGRWARDFPIPFLAIAGLSTGLYLTYIVGRADFGRDVWYGTLIVGGLPLIYATARRLWHREFASDVIATLAILAAIALDQPFAGAIIVLMQSGGEAIESYAHGRATASLERLARRAPRWAYRYGGTGIEKIAVDQVRPGDRLAIRNGDLLPVDGTIASEAATIDDSAVTGEPLPKGRLAGAHVLSGTVNVGPTFDLVALRPSAQSQYAKIIDLVRHAQTQKPAIQRLADRYATWFTPTTVVIAILAAYFDHSALTALAVLVVATPCPLILATPIAVLGAVNRCSERGIIMKSGAAVEEIGRTQVVLFDKTGTLTTGRPEVERVVTLESLPAAELLRLAAAVEQFSSHPLATAVTRPLSGTPLPLVSNHQEFPGAGVAGTIEGRRVVVGSRRLCERVTKRPLEKEWEAIVASGTVEGRLVSFLLLDGAAMGAILFEDPIRPEVPGLADKLRGLGVKEVGLLTGDNRRNAEDVAHRAGISRVEADLLPEQKVESVGKYRRQFGSTVMVGDGINDAAALATASVGIAMGAQGAGITAEAADAVLLVDDVSRVADGIALGQRMLQIAQQGILFGLGASLILMGIASFGYIAPAEGAVIQEGLDVMVIFNALRVR